jgi:hypothetical protein
MVDMVSPELGKLCKIVFRTPEDSRMNMEMVMGVDMLTVSLAFIDGMYNERSVLSVTEEAIVFERFLQTFLGELAVSVVSKKDTIDIIDVDDERQTCCVCLDNPADTLVLPCMHSCVCHTCSKQLQTSNVAKICVHCQCPITGVLENEGVDDMMIDEKK